MVLEVRPPVPLDKGSGVRALRGRKAISQLLFAGDDRSDLDAFAEATIKIAVGSKEAPPELIAAADAVVAGTPEVAELLQLPRRRSGRVTFVDAALVAPIIARFGEPSGGTAAARSAPRTPPTSRGRPPRAARTTSPS